MKTKKLIMGIMLTLSVIPLASCGFIQLPSSVNNSSSESNSTSSNDTSQSNGSSEIVSSTDDSQNSSSVIEEFAGQKITLEMMTKASGIVALDSTGEQNILVLPVCFKDYPLSKFNYDESEVKSNLEKAFFGSKEETGWESVKSFYETSSYGNLKIDGIVADVYTLDCTLVDFVNKKGNDYYDPSYYALEKATDNFKKNYTGNIKDFDQNGDGNLDAVWVIYMNPYMSDKYINDYREWEPSISYTPNLLSNMENVLWAYTYWDYETDSNVNNPEPFVYGWASYDFLWDGDYSSNGQKLVDCHTYIHETGHILGLDDYYNYDYANESTPTSPAGALDMMDNNIGDHNSYSKYLLNWVQPRIVNAKGTYTLSSFQENGDCLLIPANNSSFTDSPYDEYLLLEFYTPTGLNYLDSQYKYTNDLKLFTDYGVKVYHVDSRLGLMKFDSSKNQYDYQGFNNNYVNTYDDYSIIASSNTPSYSYSGKRLLTLLSNSHNASSNYYYQDRSYGEANNSDLFKEGSSISSFRFNNGTSLSYQISIENLTSSSVDIVIK